MDPTTISTIIVGVCTGLALLNPLVKSITAWHLSLTKIKHSAKASKASPPPQIVITHPTPQVLPSDEVFMPLWARRVSTIWNIYTYVFVLGSFLYQTYPGKLSRPATGSDVYFVGLLVIIFLQNKYVRSR